MFNRQSPFFKSFITLGSCLVLSLVAQADDRTDLSEACEVAVALSAAPQRLRADASVYALKDRSYVKVVDGTGPLTCVVERNHSDAVIPQCMDKAGIDSVLPAIIARSMMALDGASSDDITAASQDKLDSGEHVGATRPGLSYMMSPYNYIFVQSSNQVLKVPPHVMFYGPSVTNEDIGGSFSSMVNNIGTPFVFNEGPHGYMVVYTQYPASHDDVAKSCRGELGEPPPAFDPFPKG